MNEWIKINDHWGKVNFQKVDSGLVTTLKVKQVEGTGYRKYYYLNLSWFNTPIEEVKMNLMNSTCLEDINGSYADIGEGTKPESV